MNAPYTQPHQFAHHFTPLVLGLLGASNMVIWLPAILAAWVTIASSPTSSTNFCAWVTSG